MFPRVLRHADSLALAREDAWAPGEAVAVPFVPRDALPLDRRDELDEDAIVGLFETRGEKRERVFAAADRLRRQVCGDEVSYVVTRNIQYTNVRYFRCGFCAFSKGKLAANLRGPAYLVPHEEIARRITEAWQRGASEVCLQGGIHPAFTGDYYESVVRTVMNESISRAAGAEHGQEMTPEQLETLIRANGRTPRQRTTLYDDAPAERRAASLGAAALPRPRQPRLATPT